MDKELFRRLHKYPFRLHSPPRGGGQSWGCRLRPRVLRVTRHIALPVAILFAFAVAGLPGTTSAASDLAPPRIHVAPLPHPPSVPGNIADEPRAALSATDGILGARARAPGTPLRPSYFANAQVVSVYGHPGAKTMGELGVHPPEEIAAVVQALAAEYDRLNGDRGVIAALHLIVDVAQAKPQSDGSYLSNMPLDDVRTYVEIARREGMLLFLDLQIGWGDPVAAVRRLRPFLSEPFVHVALDPEFATRARRAAPGVVIGALDAETLNAVQEYLDGIVRRYDLPPKILVIHQFLVDMIKQPEDIALLPAVEITIDMDGFGPPGPKIGGYERYAMATYAQRAAIKLFYHWDVPLMSPADVLALAKTPDYVIYQ